ncbi:MAG TPA: enoyl-CoA hydratase [Dehalococcoidia bacterium]|nr:enoyl-CoA hydratase [Dehalococcoidia bacterium]
MTSYKNLILKKEDRVATIILNRPEKLNALNAELTEEIIRAVSEVGQDDEVRAVIITGAGRAFCSGADISSPDFKAMSPAVSLKLMEKASQVVMGIRNMPKPVIAAVNGFAVGGGCNLALAGDIVVASEEAKFSQPYVFRGLHPDFGAIYFLPRLVGFAKASELLLTGRVIEANEADRIGLVSRVVPADQLESVTRELATTLAKFSPLVVGMMKASLQQALATDLPTALDCEAKAQSILFMTEDFKEATAAFMEKREPIFKGK